MYSPLNLPSPVKRWGYSFKISSLFVNLEGMLGLGMEGLSGISQEMALTLHVPAISWIRPSSRIVRMHSSNFIAPCAM